MTKERNKGIDILRFICSLMVIFIHVGDDKGINSYILDICRIASPIFFMISGYCNSMVDENKINNHIKKLIKITIFINIFYLIYFFIKYAFYGNLNALYEKIFNTYSLIEILLFNANPILHRLWFFTAIIYVLIIDKIVMRKVNKRTKLIISIVLLLINISLGSYSKLLFNRVYSEIFVRNFMFLGLPFYNIGSLIKESDKEIAKINIIIVIAIVFNILETCLLKKSGLYGNREMFISTIILSISLFISFVNKNFSNEYQLFSNLGKNISLQMYEYHKIFEEIYGLVFDSIISSNLFNYLFVCASTIVFSILLSKIDKNRII